ncbi:hypothetical protein HOG98_07620 [bacterium]|jgi:hypothetical protein|nr:hypothetical protein [bacterium]
MNQFPKSRKRVNKLATKSIKSSSKVSPAGALDFSGASLNIAEADLENFESPKNKGVLKNIVEQLQSFSVELENRD